MVHDHLQEVCLNYSTLIRVTVQRLPGHPLSYFPPRFQLKLRTSSILKDPQPLKNGMTKEGGSDIARKELVTEKSKEIDRSSPAILKKKAELVKNKAVVQADPQETVKKIGSSFSSKGDAEIIENKIGSEGVNGDLGVEKRSKLLGSSKKVESKSAVGVMKSKYGVKVKNGTEKISSKKV